jgi:hypothetical protein
MDLVKKIAVVTAIGFFVLYLLGTISGVQSHPREKIGPYIEYYGRR